MDANAKPLLLLSGDDASLLTTVLAPNKAYTALMLNRDTKQVGARMRELHVAPPSYGDARITDFAGGVLIRNQSVGVVGAVGVSGATPMQDHALAVLARNQIFPPYPEFDYEEADAADD
ncbi:heme-binding protein [Candidatus Saccharibacteria bacterium]|nr:heme-binding protein [Candidatus Saccharibacteria bacterium]